jgi:hypothetical protein
MDVGRVIACPCSFLEILFLNEPKKRGSSRDLREMLVKTPAG